MSEDFFEKMRNTLDPKTERPNSWKPAQGDIVRPRGGTDFNRIGLERAGIRIHPEKFYQVRECRKAEDSYLLSLDEVNVQYIMGKRIVAITRPVEDPLNIDLFEPATEHQEKEE